MFISELSIKNFGSFESAEFSFAPTGISAICGANGTGKSQIVGATLAAIIGRRAIKIDQAGIGPSQVRISVEEGNATEEISLAISTNAQGEPLIEESTQPRHPGPLRRRLLTAISGSAGPHLYLPRDPRPNTLSAQDIDLASELFPDDLKKDPSWLDLRASGMLESPAQSGGVATLGVLIREFLERKRNLADGCTPPAVGTLIPTAGARASRQSSRSRSCAAGFRRSRPPSSR